jgi:biopolymer transport protein ExbB
MLALATIAPAAETLADAVKRVAVDYDKQIQQAVQDLERARARLAAEKAPLLREREAAQQKLLGVQRDIARLEVGAQNVAERRRKLGQTQESIRKTIAFLNSSSRDALRGYQDGLAPGEDQLVAEKLATLQAALDEGAAGNPAAAGDTLEFLVQRVREAAGGHVAPGRALVLGDNQLRSGTLAFVGPDAWFLPDQGNPTVLRTQAGTTHPTGYPIAGWERSQAEPFFRGHPGRLMLDISGGKALRLHETRGSVWHHIQTGGMMAYVILATGFLAVVLIVQKLIDLSQMRLDGAAEMQRLTVLLARGKTAEVEAALPRLKRTTGGLLANLLQHRTLPRSLVEEHLQSWLHGQQMHFERRLSLLAVVATAAPLMGLLGTVSGMVNTFALMTVFGAGNAMKLSAGISEVLVATELGLLVAIPSLVMHGFLSHRIRKNIALLEHYAIELAIALETGRRGPDAAPPLPAQHETVV